MNQDGARQEHEDMEEERSWHWTEIIGLIAVLDAHGQWCRSGGESGARANLANANLKDANLRGTVLNDANLRGAYLRGANLRCANLERANLEDANLKDANLKDANLTGANLTDAYLTDANLERAKLRGANLRCANLERANLEGVPVVERLDARIAEILEAGDGELDMSRWHGDGGVCGTTHCRAGWAIHLAGDEGRALELNIGPAAAGALIYAKSVGYVPNFYAGNAEALADIRERAKRT